MDLNLPETVGICWTASPRHSPSEHNIHKYSLADINAAISLMKDAIKAADMSEVFRADRLAQLGAALHIRFGAYSGSMKDLNDAVAYLLESAETVKIWHPDCAVFYGNLASEISTRFEATGGLEDLDRAIDIDQG
jgi:hypothetical protein